MSRLIDIYDVLEFGNPIGLAKPEVDLSVIDGLMFGVGPTQQNINIVQVTETEIALAITSQKRIAVAQVSETNIAQLLTKGRNVSVAQVSETDTVFPIAKVKTKTITQVTETNTALNFTSVKNIAIEPAEEINVVEFVVSTWPAIIIEPSIKPRKQSELTLVAESDIANPIYKVKQSNIQQTLETDSVQPIGKKKLVTVNTVVETEAALEITVVVRDNKLPQVSENDIALPITAVKIVNVNFVEENNFSLQLARVLKQANISFAEEVDEAGIVDLFYQIFVSVNTAVETDRAYPIRTFGPAGVNDDTMQINSSDPLSANIIEGYIVSSIASSGYDISTNIFQDTIEVNYENSYIQEKNEYL